MVGGGDGEDIYFRASQELANLLDREVEKRKKQHPGLPISRAGLSRELLYFAFMQLTLPTYGQKGSVCVS